MKDEKQYMKNNLFGDIHHATLDNGLQLIVNTDHTIPKVSIQLWYRVGSKDEGSGQRGLAHLLEHMIFKGTKRLSESDINLITTKLSGYTNAFTSYDYTGYMFDFPKQQWSVALDLLADCMTDCQFNEDMLQSELKAVVQELKLYKDDYSVSLMEAMMSNIFADHSYHHPVIGYKQDLWTITRAGLLDFYKQYYHPGNATLVVVGAVDYDEVMRKTKHYFESITSGQNVQKNAAYIKNDIQATAITLYRDVQRPQITYAWTVPGLSQNKAFVTTVVAHIIGESKNSLLYKRLVDELNVATHVSLFFEDAFECGVLFIQIEPVDDTVIQLIDQEVYVLLDQLHTQGVKKESVVAAINQTHMAFLLQTEEFQERAYIIGKGYLATDDVQYLEHYVQSNVAVVEQQVQEFITTFMRKSVTHKGLLLPLPMSEKKYWLDLQKESDRTDTVILSRKVRQMEVEPGNYVNEIAEKPFADIDLPRYKKYVLTNGLTLLHHPFARGDKVEIVCDFDAHYYYDPEHLQGLGNFAFALLQEGTKYYKKQELMQLLATKGMELEISAARISLSLLKKDIECGLHILYELLEHAMFEQDAIDRVREHILLEIIDYWDNPNEFVKQLVREHIYQGHPYAQHPLGTQETIERITREDLICYYKTHIVPMHARLAIIGVADDIEALVNSALHSWSGSQVDLLQYPTVQHKPAQEMLHHIVRDQVVLVFAGLSVDYHDPLYDALSLFDQILVGDMSSQLFQLRERTGLFYSIGGSLVYASSKQPGIVYIKTMVSQDRLAEAEKAIKDTLQSAPTRFTEQELLMAKNGIIAQIIDQYATQKGLAESFLFIERLHLPIDYFQQRIDTIKQLHHATVAQAAASVLLLRNISTFKVGRVL